jgi:putative ABC transport system permease protein
MMDGMEDFDPQWVELMRNPPRSRIPGAGIVLGEIPLARLGKQVGDVFKVKSISHRQGIGARQPIEFDFEIVAALPKTNRWSEAGVVDYGYFNEYLRDSQNQNEFADQVTWALVQVDDQETARQAAGTIERNLRELRAETLSAAYSRFMEPLQNILWFIKFLLVPAIWVVLTLVLANTFALTLRERQQEMAMLKVLGFRPNLVLVLVLGEAILVGVLAGLLGAGLTFVSVNHGFGGIQMVGWPLLMIPLRIFWWGLAIGTVTALLGGLIPAWRARGIKAAQVFANAT